MTSDEYIISPEDTQSCMHEAAAAQLTVEQAVEMSSAYSRVVARRCVKNARQ